MSGGNSVYSPLPQSNSDSDELSEEELHSSNERQKDKLKRLSQFQKQATPEIISNGKKQKATNYKHAQNVRDAGIALNGFQLASDEIAVLKANNKIEKFSTSRKMCFVFSIFLCISTTVVFLWVLPCEIGSCPSPPNLGASSSWKKLLSGIELRGPISVVPRARGRNHNLIFLYRNSFKPSNETGMTPRGGGVMSLFGVSGKLSWRVVLEREPKDIDCNIIDVDFDGANDCLVVDANNLVQAIHSLSGKKLWEVHGSTVVDSKSCDLSFPIALPDLNSDRVSDLLTICTVNDRGREELVTDRKNYFILISGLNGTVMRRPKEISRCYSISNFMLEKENFVSYTCLDPANEESLKTVPLVEIISDEESPLSKKILLNETNLRTQHKTKEEDNTFYLQGRRVNVENEGRCPDECTMLITIKDERNEKKNQTMWTMKSSSSYGMIPVILKFDKFSGFVLKYWHWEFDKGKSSFPGSKTGNDSASGKSTRTKKRIRRLNVSKSLEVALLGESEEESVREKRMLAEKESDGGKQSQGHVFREESGMFRRIVERVVLIVFNETDSHSVNASQSEIVQMCKKGGCCQPDAAFQRHSLLITDVDEDGFQELISYSSTFVDASGQESASPDVGWQLQSTVQVIRLEEELHKLYDSKNP